ISEGWWRGVAAGILGVLTHLSVHNLFDNLYVHTMYLHVAILLGLLFVSGQHDAPPQSPPTLGGKRHRPLSVRPTLGGKRHQKKAYLS
nr:hypothetical protein [Anaerolineales bacterium]